MHITVNNKPEILDRDSISIAELKQLKNFTFSKIIIKHNNLIIEPEEYHNTFVRDGDVVVMLHLLAGG
ncbi:MAG: sulfur carrier protein ThiS [Saprospiraceae bacterium]|nr:sulfur carrier protein ThiS [Saprospiraceae bacterium]